MKYRTIAFIGSGNIVYSVIDGIIKYAKYPPSMITISSPTIKHRYKIQNKYGVISTNDNFIAAEKSDVIVLAVKPQIMREVCKLLKNINDRDKKLILTFAAGIPIHRYNDYFSYDVNLIRIMPSILSSTGKGVIGLFSKPKVSKKDIVFVNELMKNIGLTIWCKNEEDINKIIAISGSSPAFIFLFMEAMQRKTEQLGYDKKTARKLIINIFDGSIELSKTQNDIDFSALYKRVASKNGTTEIALNKLRNGFFQEIIAESMQSVFDFAKNMESFF